MPKHMGFFSDSHTDNDVLFASLSTDVDISGLSLGDACADVELNGYSGNYVSHYDAADVARYVRVFYAQVCHYNDQLAALNHQIDEKLEALRDTLSVELLSKYVDVKFTPPLSPMCVSDINLAGLCARIHVLSKCLANAQQRLEQVDAVQLHAESLWSGHVIAPR